MNRATFGALALLTVGAALADAPKEHVVDQKDKQFSAQMLSAKVGDTITFRNVDSVSHNIFSLSDVQSFDIGTYGTGQSRSIKLEHDGVVDVECAVHPNMKLQIKVAK